MFPLTEAQLRTGLIVGAVALFIYGTWASLRDLDML